MPTRFDSRHFRALSGICLTLIIVPVTVCATEIARARLCSRGVRRCRRKLRAGRVETLRATACFLDYELKACFCMTRANFESLLRLLEGRLHCNHEMARRTSEAAISPSTRLAITLRLLAGASYIDIILGLNVCTATVYPNAHRVVQRINEVIPLPGIPFHDSGKLHAMAWRFTQSRASPMFGCFRALDGILIPFRSLQKSSAQESSSVERATMQFPYKSFAMLPTGLYLCLV
jgi:hypothetical protein